MGGGLHRELHVDQALRHEHLVVRLEDDVFVAAALFDDALEVDLESLAVFAGELHLALVRKITETRRRE